MGTVTKTTCNRCGKELQLRAEDETGEPLELDERGRKLAERMAALIICNGCAARYQEAEERQDQQAASEGRLRASGLPLPLRGLEWTDLVRQGKREVAIAAAIQWANAKPEEARGLYLWGPTGTGKTRVAATAAFHRLTSGHSLKWISVAVLLARLEGSFADNERQHALDVLTGAGAIVLDDIDKVNPSEAKRAQLFAAIDRRVDAGVPMLITGNLSPTKLEGKLGAPIASRLLGHCLGRTHEMDGPDRRMSLGL
jgi:DNA replication protein DnaC